jgi:hypothetical protein
VGRYIEVIPARSMMALGSGDSQNYQPVPSHWLVAWIAGAISEGGGTSGSEALEPLWATRACESAISHIQVGADERPVNSTASRAVLLREIQDSESILITHTTISQPHRPLSPASPILVAAIEAEVFDRGRFLLIDRDLPGGPLSCACANLARAMSRGPESLNCLTESLSYRATFIRF